MKGIFKTILTVLLLAPTLALATSVTWDYTSPILRPIQALWTTQVQVPYITATSTATSTLPNLTTTNTQVTGKLYDTSSPGQNGYVLKSTGTGITWVATSTLGLGGAGGGTVTSVDMSVPTGFSISGNPIINSGTLALSYLAGYSGFLTASGTNWNTFYNTPSNRITAGNNLSWNGNTLNSLGFVGTTSNGVAGQASYWTGASTLGTVATGTLTTSATGLQFDATRGLFGGSAVLSLTSGYGIPLTASTSNWDSFYVTPSTRISAGTNLSWSGNTLNASIPGGISTSTTPNIGDVAYWTGSNTLGTIATGTLTTTATGLQLSATRGLLGGASILSYSAGYGGFLTASGTNWNNFYNTPSTVITAGTNLSWSGNTLNASGGAGSISTSTVPTIGNLAYWTSASALSSIATTSLTASGALSLSQPISVIGGSASALTCLTASGSQAGCLSTTDWTTFNNKAGTAGPVFTGTPTFQNLFVSTTGTTTLGYASTTALTVSGNGYINALTLTGSTAGVLTTNSSGVVSASTTIGDGYISDALTVSGGNLGSNTIVSSPTWTNAGTLTIGGTVAHTNFTAVAGTTTSASSTNLFATNASTTNFWGAGLSTCNGVGQALTWDLGQYGCGTITAAGDGVSNWKQLVSDVLSPSTTIGIAVNSSSTFNGALNVASSSYNYINNLFSVSTTSDSAGSLFNIFSTSSTLVASAGVLATDPGVRALFGSSPGYNSTTVRDQLVINGRLNTGQWTYNDCTVIQSRGGFSADNTSGIQPCAGWEFQVDTAGGLFADYQNSQPFSTLCQANSSTCSAGTAAAGVGAAFAYMTSNATSIGDFIFATSTPVMDTYARINGPQGATSTRFIIGYTNLTVSGSAFEIEPTAGCYFVASTTAANWQAKCLTSIGATTIVDTGFASTTNVAATGAFQRFRIEADSTHAQFFMASSTAPLRKVADISTTYPSTVVLNEIFMVASQAAGKSSGLDFARVRSWTRQPFNF